MEDFELLSVIGSLATAVATIILVVLLWRTIRQMEATVVLSRIQTEFRFRPWIGPVNGIKSMGKNSEGRFQFDVTIKNYGELPATNVKASFTSSNKMIKKSEISFTEDQKFNLGPLLPTMEKHFWFFIDEQTFEKAKKSQEELFIAVSFEYPITDRTSSYAMISQYNPDLDEFVHIDMWVTGTDPTKK
ncbi:MAG: hypothetical protein K5790_06575 [Nitrosopumilus sp.]|uniref:hypothetical protein n=1 Tax=Nitrosopumilus sp. TaxID=2024843 RepID=UPI00247DA78F|nr:hypothetical protein [Nitrosopumilus sp.]MCV0392942.1 hypothetical protein [Nitrosopumilus sp.]